MIIAWVFNEGNNKSRRRQDALKFLPFFAFLAYKNVYNFHKIVILTNL